MLFYSYVHTYVVRARRRTRNDTARVCFPCSNLLCVYHLVCEEKPRIKNQEPKAKTIYHPNDVRSLNHINPPMLDTHLPNEHRAPHAYRDDRDGQV